MADISLADIYGGNPGAFSQGMDQFALQQAIKQTELEKNQIANLFDQQANPLRLTGLDLRNQTEQAQLPGVQAQSTILGNNAKKSNATIDADIQDTLANYKGKASKAELDAIGAMADKYAQVGAMISRMPPNPAFRGMAKQLLGEHYRPEFDNIPDDKLGTVLSNVGAGMQQASSAFQKKLQEAELKGQWAYDRGVAVANIGNQGRIAAAQIRAQAAQKNTKESWQQAAARYFEMAQQAKAQGNETDADYFEQLSTAAQTRAERLAPQPNPEPVLSPSAAPGVLVPRPTRPEPEPVPTKRPASSVSTNAKGYPTPQTQEQYNALPKGTVYLDTDGKLKRKS